jgi:hypothetical protein
MVLSRTVEIEVMTNIIIIGNIPKLIGAIESKVEGDFSKTNLSIVSNIAGISKTNANVLGSCDSC